LKDLYEDGITDIDNKINTILLEVGHIMNQIPIPETFKVNRIEPV